MASLTSDIQALTDGQSGVTFAGDLFGNRMLTLTDGQNGLTFIAVVVSVSFQVLTALVRVGRLLQIPFTVSDGTAELTVTGLPSWAEVIRSVDGLSGTIQGIPPSDEDIGTVEVTIDVA